MGCHLVLSHLLLPGASNMITTQMPFAVPMPIEEGKGTKFSALTWLNNFFIECRFEHIVLVLIFMVQIFLEHNSFTYKNLL